MSFFGQLFGSPKAATDMIDTVANGLDKLHYSEQERAQANERAQAVILEWIKNSQGQSLSRRFLTVCVTLTWLFLMLTGVLFSILSIWITGSANEFKESYTVLNDGARSMDSIMLLIIGFYFSSPYLSKFSDAAIERYKHGRKSSATSDRNND